VTLRTALFWTLLGEMTVTQGTLAVAMRVQGVMRPSMGSLWGPWPRWVRLGSVIMLGGRPAPGVHPGHQWVGRPVPEYTIVSRLQRCDNPECPVGFVHRD